MSRQSDRWFLVLWTGFALTVILLRMFFNGEGVRHVDYIMNHSAPALGEARWLLFPAFLFAILRPLHALGVIHSTQEALLPFGLATVVFSVIYLAALRAWLVKQGVPTSRRWIALATASVCSPFLWAATDTAEPLFAASFCVVGLAVVARTQRLPLGVLLMSLGLLLHQTVFVAFFLLPMAAGWDRLRDLKGLVRSAWIVALVVSAILTILVVANHISLSDALERILLVYRNPIHMNWMRGGPLKGVAVTLIAGFPSALVTLPGMHGLREILSGLRHLQLASLGLAFRIAFGFALVVAGVAKAYGQKRWEWLVALVGFSILPIIWNNVYSYPKFYVLFPVLVAHVVARVSPRISVPVFAILALLNVSALIGDVHLGRRRYSARSVQYRNASGSTTWLTSNWQSEFPYLWPGRTCAMLKSLAQASTAPTVESLRAERTGEFMSCVKEAFCSGQPVWTDDWIIGNADAIGEIAAYHGLPKEFLDKTWWYGPRDGQEVDASPASALRMFSAERRSEVCRSFGEADVSKRPLLRGSTTPEIRP